MSKEYDRCISCEHYQYIDTKLYPGGSFDWGYCHREISRDTKDEEEMFDLTCYFEVSPKHFCGYHEKKNIMNTIPFSSSKHKEHSNKKSCCCGGHNSSNPKSDLKHNSTKSKYLVRLTRKMIKKFSL